MARDPYRFNPLYNARCPRRPVVQTVIVVSLLAYLCVTVIFPWLGPIVIVAATLAASGIVAYVVTRVTRRRRARSGACLSCTHPCVQRLRFPDAGRLPLSVPPRHADGLPDRTGTPVTLPDPGLTVDRMTADKDWLCGCSLISGVLYPCHRHDTVPPRHAGSQRKVVPPANEKTYAPLREKRKAR